MPRAKAVSNADGQRIGWAIYCPGCKERHVLDDRWKFNGDVERPSFGPVKPGTPHSLAIRSGHFARAHKPGDTCWCDWAKEHGEPPPFECSVCHTYITDGKIQYLADCTHALVGQTVDLPDLDTIGDN